MSLERARHLAAALCGVALASTAAFVGLVLVNAPMGGGLTVGFSFSAIGWQLASDVMWVTVEPQTVSLWVRAEAT